MMTLILTASDVLKCAEDSKGRNQGFTDKIIELIDPDGYTVVQHTLLHNDEEMRLTMYLKFKGDSEPHYGICDISFELYDEIVSRQEIYRKLLGVEDGDQTTL